jgi:hypothetical protein
VTLAFRWQCITETVLDVFLRHSPVATFVFFLTASPVGFLLVILRQIYLAWPVWLTTVQHSILAQCHQLSHLHKGSRDHQHERSVPNSASLGWTFIRRCTICAMENMVIISKNIKAVATPQARWLTGKKTAFKHLVLKGKAIPLQAWCGPEGSRKLRFPDFMTTAQDGGKVVSLTHRPPLPPGNTPGTHFCYSWVDPRATVRPEGLWHHRESNPRPAGL